MRQSQPTTPPRELPKPVIELCAHLEERGIRSLSHGEGLLEDLRTPRQPDSGPSEEIANRRGPTRSILCAGTPHEIYRALPRAVVTSEEGVRLTQATASGPVDVICSGERTIEEILPAFGLGPLAIGFRLANESWVDPANQLTALRQGRLALVPTETNAFEAAPRRYWIAARLIAEYDLDPTPELVEAATSVFASLSARLPLAIPARRELTRILASRGPGRALRFLRETGVAAHVVPGTNPPNDDRIEALPALPAVRWAAWLRGSATARAMVRLRVPHALARRVEKLQTSHPIDRAINAGREGGIRKLMTRLSEEEIEALFEWRRLELAEERALSNEAGTANSAPIEGESRLLDLEDRIAKIRSTDSQVLVVRALVLDGAAVMALLGTGPGRHVGRALAHLAQFVADDPEANVRERLESELIDWAQQNTNLLD